MRTLRLPLTVFLGVVIPLLSTTVNNQTFSIDQMISYQLNCTVSNFKFGVVTSKWSKKQVDDAASVLLFVDDKPFRPMTGDFERYNTSHNDRPNGFQYYLRIYNTQPQDSGEYICEVLDAKGKTAFRMNYSLNVFAPVESVILFKNFSDVNSTTVTPLSPFRYSFTRPGSIGCHVIGGNPLPNVTLLLGSRDPLPRSFLLITKTWSGSDAGFQKPSWEVITYSDHLKILPEYDGENVACVASIQSYNASSNNTILVDAVPYFHANNCLSEQAAVPGRKKVQLTCRFHSHPAGQVSWRKVSSDETEGKGAVTDGQQSTVILDGRNDFIAMLVFSKISDDIFRYYNLTVSNDVGSNSTIIQLLKNGQSAVFSDLQVLITTLFMTPFFHGLATTVVLHSAL